MGTATIYELRSREGARVGRGRADAGARHHFWARLRHDFRARLRHDFRARLRHDAHAPAGLEKRRPSVGLAAASKSTSRSDRPSSLPRPPSRGRPRRVMPEACKQNGGGFKGKSVPDRGAEGVGAGGWAESGEGSMNSCPWPHIDPALQMSMLTAKATPPERLYEACYGSQPGKTNMQRRCYDQ